MTALFAGLAALELADLDRLANLVSSDRLDLPPTAASLALEGFRRVLPQLEADFADLARQDFTRAQAATFIRALAATRRYNPGASDQIDMVITGPDAGGAARDTAVVMNELFLQATRSVLVVGFAVHDGRSVFKTLAARLDATPTLHATLCLDVSRRVSDTSRDDDVIARFASRFVASEWPGLRLPKVYFDPRALALHAPGAGRAVLHAKCVVIDDERVLVTSANLTSAAQQRNVELGLLVRVPSIAAAIRQHFERLILDHRLRPLPIGPIPRLDGSQSAEAHGANSTGCRP